MAEVKTETPHHPFSGRARRKQRDSFFSEEVDLINGMISPAHASGPLEVSNLWSCIL